MQKSVTVTKIPNLDLRTLGSTGPIFLAAETRAFCDTHSAQFKSVLVTGLDGVQRYLSTTTELTAWVITNLTTQVVPAGKEAYITITDPSDVVKTFLELTQYTVPHGNELQFYDEALQGLGFERNKHGNYWATVGDGTSKTLFVAHLDTADRGVPLLVKHVMKPFNYLGTDGRSVLGADDRAGVAVMLYMMSQNVPGDYLMVLGEEVGCVGSGLEAGEIVKGRYNRAIQFDRAGTSEVITHQVGLRTASKEFARALCKQLRVKSDNVIQLQPSDRGVYTDTKEFTHLIQECTNISVGYEGQHTVAEIQDMSYLVTLASAAAKVHWETLPTRNAYALPYSSAAAKWGYPAASDYKWGEEDDAYELYDANDSYEKGGKDMWEMWTEIDLGNWDAADVKSWVVHNPARAAQILFQYMSSDSVGSLQVLADVEVK